MNLKQALTRKLWAALPPDQQQALVYDFLDWLYSDLQPAQRREKANLLAPRLMEWIEAGDIGLPGVLYQHLIHLFQRSFVARWVRAPK